MPHLRPKDCWVVGIWESSYHQETPHGAWLQGGAGELSLDATDHLDIFLQVDEAVAVLQAHHAKKEAAQKVGAVAAATS